MLPDLAKRTVLLATLCAASMCFPDDVPDASVFRVEIDLSRKAKEGRHKVPTPPGAKKLLQRYLNVLAWTNPLINSRGNAPRIDGKGDDKDVTWVAAVTVWDNSLALVTSNLSKTDRTLELVIKDEFHVPLAPVYRRVWQNPASGQWERLAWETPRATDLRPYTVELPANTVQTVLIRLRDPRKKGMQ